MKDSTHEHGIPHPLHTVIDDSVAILSELGFVLARGPEAETEYYNFDSLNIPQEHPARDLWDTFWLTREYGKEKATLLRTHTSPVQVRFAKTHTPPFRIISPGKVFRHEATDSTHEAQFYQIEGLVIEEGIHLGHLKSTIEFYFSRLFEQDTQVRFRPSFFPFVEPGVEVDILHSQGGVSKWLEVMGAGMVHPKVIASMGYDPRKYSGFAFGGGVDRFAMIRYKIPDVRILYQGDLRLNDSLTLPS